LFHIIVEYFVQYLICHSIEFKHELCAHSAEKVILFDIPMKIACYCLRHKV
jgi:hypothetical protein